jgi:transposase
MMETLPMSTKERQRLQILGHLKHGKSTVAKAAAALGLSERQMYRVLSRHRSQGDQGLLHQLRGRSSNRGYPPEVRQEVIRLHQETYSDYGPTLFAEMLQEYHTLLIDSETIRRWLKAAGLWHGVRAARKHRRKRERRDAIGSLVQFDGSIHKWFEDRGPACCLLVAIDDASSRVFMRFVPQEDGFHVLMTLRAYVERFGIPREVYVDLGSVYYARTHRLTDVARALARLGIRVIHARSPQAKGRVERSNRTHQDRLLKALRRHNISTIDQANEFLQRTYLREHNARFAAQEHLADLHRSAETLDLDNIFCFETTRHVNYDFTIMLAGQFIQLLPSPVPLPPPRQVVTVRRWLDGSLHIAWNGQELNYSIFKQRPKPRPHTPNIPDLDHPWRHKTMWTKTNWAKHKRNIKLASKQNNPILPQT